MVTKQHDSQEWDRYTLEQRDTTKKVLDFLGQESYNHTIVVFTHCKKSQTENRSKMESDFGNDLKSFLEKVGNRWIIAPDPDIYGSNDPIVKHHIDNLKSYINKIQESYTTSMFDRVRNKS